MLNTFPVSPPAQCCNHFSHSPFRLLVLFTVSQCIEFEFPWFSLLTFGDHFMGSTPSYTHNDSRLLNYWVDLELNISYCWVDPAGSTDSLGPDYQISNWFHCVVALLARFYNLLHHGKLPGINRKMAQIAQCQFTLGLAKSTSDFKNEILGELDFLFPL